MENLTIEEIRTKKEQLEKSFLMVIKEFEEQTTLEVKNISVVRTLGLGTNKSVITRIHIDAGVITIDQFYNLGG